MRKISWSSAEIWQGDVLENDIGRDGVHALLRGVAAAGAADPIVHAQLLQSLSGRKLLLLEHGQQSSQSRKPFRQDG